MDDIKKRRLIHKKPVRVDVRHAFEFICSQKGIWFYVDKTFGQTAGKNLFFLLHFMVDKCTDTTPQGKQTSKKDIAQTHWHSQSYIANELGIKQSRVSEGLTALEKGGLITQIKVEGKGNFFAFSELYVKACEYFSAYQTRREEHQCSRPSATECRFFSLEKPIPSLSVSPDGRIWLIRRSEVTYPAVGSDPSDGRNSPYIEGKIKGIPKPKENPDGSGEPGQASLPGVDKVGVCELDGILKGLYGPLVTTDLVVPIVRSMKRIATHEQISDFLTRRRSMQTRLRTWGVKDPDVWLADFKSWLAAPPVPEPDYLRFDYAPEDRLPTAEERASWAVGCMPF